MLKPELQAKFLQHINRKKKDDEGFTLIELLVVVIIIGVLAAIALPSLLGQVNKAKQAEAKQNIGVANRTQQAFFAEYQNYATSVAQLQVGIRTQTDNYSYNITASNATANAYAVIRATLAPNKTGLKTYYGLTGTVLGDAATSEALTLAIACESKLPGAAMPAITTFSTDCNTNFTTLAR